MCSDTELAGTCVSFSWQIILETLAVYLSLFAAFRVAGIVFLSQVFIRILSIRC